MTSSLSDGIKKHENVHVCDAHMCVTPGGGHIGEFLGCMGFSVAN